MRVTLGWFALAIVVYLMADLLDYLMTLDRRVTRLELARAGLSPNGPWGVEKEKNDG